MLVISFLTWQNPIDCVWGLDGSKALFISTPFQGMTRYFCEILASVRAGLVVAKRWSIGRRHASRLLGRQSRNPFQPLPTWTQSVGTLFRPPLLRNRSPILPKSLQTLNLKRFTISSFEVIILSFCIFRRFCQNRILKGPFDYLSMF